MESDKKARKINRGFEMYFVLATFFYFTDSLS